MRDATTPTERLDAQELERALADADVRVLVLCAFQMTGDRRWLEPPYAPKRDVRLIADRGGGLDEEAAAEVRRTIAGLLERGVRTAAIDDPDEPLLGEMMSVCLGERVAPEYVAMMREDMGLASGEASWSMPVEERAAALETMNVLVVGAGLSGLELGYRLAQLGVAFTIVEKNDDVGGTWLENRYPGCRVDTPNHFYSLSHRPNHAWGHYFSPQPELLDYARRFADDEDLRPRIRFGTELVAARFDEGEGVWVATVRGERGSEELRARVLVSAIGHFNSPAKITIPGAETFDGPIFHTARWPEGLDLAGKRVAVVGSGASSMQVVPSIADEVATLTIYQRSPQWAHHVPEYRDRVPAGTQWLLEHVPGYAVWNRFTLFWRYGDGLLRHLRKDPAWPHPERSLNRANDRHRERMAAYIEAELEGRPDLVAKCLPTYPPYGKRILIDNGWFRTLRRPNVELVTDPIERITADDVVARDGSHRPADVVVLATGFSVTDLSARIDLVGRGGRTLAEDWAEDNPRAHLGMTVPGFPNFFCLFGPNTNMGHGGSGIFLAECQTRYVTRAVVAMVENGWRAVEVKPEVRDAFVRRVDEEHEQLVWTHPGMSTYYRNRHGRVVSPMPFRLVDYWSMTHDPDPEDFLCD